MATARKLQSEIDRTLKKLSEGVDFFDEVWNKVYAAPTRKEKEKHEAELKKEIKKLQRFRDTIKSWIASTDVKEKSALIEARKVVEIKMEEFKICERETKTKAYSNEGLAQGGKIDPSEQARLNTREWIRSSINQLQDQIDAFESDLEILNSKNKRQNKQEILQLQQLDTRHQWHIEKLELIQRLLDNNAIEPETIDQVKDDVEYYLEANMEPDFMEVYGTEDIYEALELESLGLTKVDSTEEIIIQEEEEEDEVKEEEVIIPSAAAAAAPPTNTIPINIGRPKPVEPKISPKATMQEALKNTTVVRETPPTISRVTTPPPTTTTAPTLSDEYRQILRIIDASVNTAPENIDSERLKPHVVKNPYPTPVTYPNTPAGIFENQSVFSEFDTDTLFFIFYYQQGTYQQYLAARELKKQTWAYHKKYMTWFKRHEEPKFTCDEYEQGTYVYFDYETGWCQRIKSEFTFEYSYLEDELTLAN